MAEKEFGAELWVVLALYVLLLNGVLIYAALLRWRKSGQQHDEGRLVDHYLAGREIGPVVLGFSVCASMFSGYTCVGLPAEAYDNGFSAWRWVGSSTWVSLVYMAYTPRLQWLARERGYDSVFSFMRERYGIHDARLDPLHWLMVVVTLVPCYIYLCAQFDAFGNTLNSISNEAISPLGGAFILAVVIAIYEILGGLRAVALTDFIQGSTLLLGAMLILVFMGTTFGGLPSLTKHLEEESPSHVWVLDSSAGLSWAEFWIGIGVQRAVFPDYPQRAMAAKSQNSLRWANVILAISPFLIQVPLLFYGIVGAVNHPGLDNSKDVFSEVVLDIIHDSTAGRIFGSVMMAAVIAAVMSTADSVLIVVSQIITLEIIRPFTKAQAEQQSNDGGEEVSSGPDRTPTNRLIFASRVVTLCAAFICIPIVISNFNLSFLIQFQSSILAQTAPTLIFGLYWKGMHKWSCTAGLLVGVCTGVGLVGNEIEGGILISLGLNLLVTLVVAVLLPQAAKPVSKAHASFLELVTWRPPTLEKCFHAYPCSREPISHNWWMFLLAAAASWFALPFYREPEALDPQVLGSPLWAVTSLAVLLLIHGLLIYIIAMNWRGGDLVEDTPTAKHVGMDATLEDNGKELKYVVLAEAVQQTQTNGPQCPLCPRATCLWRM